MTKLTDKHVQHAVESYDTISPTGVLRLAEECQRARASEARLVEALELVERAWGETKSGMTNEGQRAVVSAARAALRAAKGEP